jgi:hypothetical protein
MLQYLSGIRKQPKQKPSKALVKNRIVKNLLKKSPPALVLKAAKKAPLIVQAVKRNAIMKRIERASPVTASKIKKATILQQRQKAIKRAGNPPIMQEVEPVQIPIEKENSEQLVKYMKSLPVEAAEENLEDQEMDFEPSEDQEEESERENEFLEGVFYPGVINGKRAAKKTAKKAAKPRVQRKNLKTQSKADARVTRAAQPKGEVLKKLIDTGAQILDKTLLPGSALPSPSRQGAESPNLPEPPQKKSGFFQSIPMPVKIGGGLALAFLAYKAFTKN